MKQIKNILITGRPGIGKTKLLRKIAEKLPGKIGGFYTEEIREKDERLGFRIIDFKGHKGILAHVRIKSPVKVSKYGVNFSDLEKIGIATLDKAQKEAEFILVDEIGKMEFASKKFISAILSVLNCPKICIATIMQKDIDLTRRMKDRSDVKLFEITFEK